MNYGPRLIYDVGTDVGSGASIGATVGSVIPGVGTLIGGAAGALVGLGEGLFQKKKANKILGQNPYPTQAMPSEELENQQIARGAAIEGMPSEQYESAQKNIQRTQAAQVAAASAAPGGAVRNIGAIQQASNDASGQLNAQSAEMRRQNIGQLLGVNNQVASWRDKLFDWNNKQKYIQNYNYGMSLLGQGNQNMMGGVDKLIGTATGAAASGMFSGGGGGGSSASGAPAAYNYNPGLAGTTSGAGSPAGLFGSLGNPSAPNYLNN